MAPHRRSASRASGLNSPERASRQDSRSPPAGGAPTREEFNAIWAKLDVIAAAVGKNQAGHPGPQPLAPSTSVPRPFAPKSVYRRVTAPEPAKAQAPAPPLGGGSLSVLGDSTTIEDTCESAPFIGAPHGNAAPVMFPGTLNKRVVERIAEDEFVDFYDVLHPDNKNYGVAVGEERELNLVAKKGKVLSEMEWIRAFCLFSVEYLTHYPDASIDLPLYCLKVIELMGEPATDWRYYDHTFRSERRKLGLSFRQMRLDLESRARSRGGPQSSRAVVASQPFRGGGGRKSERPLVPEGYCFAFHEGSHCRRSPCSFRHDCPKCGAIHPAYRGCSRRPAKRPARDMPPRSPPPGKGKNFAPPRK